MSGFDNEVLYCIGERLQPSTTQAITLMQKTADDVSIMSIIGSPEGVDSANPASLAHDRANGNLYLKKSGTGNTGWLPISTNSQDLHTSKFIVSITGTNGTGANYSSITSAVANASSGDTIFIMPGTYTENLTITKNLTFCAYTAALRGVQNVFITGKITASSANLVLGFYGIQFNTNADNSFSLTGNAAAITCENCYFNASNATAINATGNASTAFYMENCSGNIGNTFTLFTSTNATLWMKNSTFIDATTPGTSTTSAGFIRLFNSNFNIPFSVSSTGAFVIENSIFGVNQTPFINTTWITTAGTQISFIDNSTFSSGTASAISVGAGTTLTAVGLRVNSSNTNAITGAGTINFSDVSFSGSSSKVNTTTQSTLISTEFHSVVTQVFTSNGTYTPTTGMKYAILECIGSGAGGGGGASTIATISGGGGGGAGGYSRKVVSASTVGASQAVTIGSGGAGGTAGNNNGANGNSSSVGSLVSATGGTGGTGSAAALIARVAGGAGGTGSSGDINLTGGTGQTSLGLYAVNFGSWVFAGNGGNSFFGYGGIGGSMTDASGAGSSVAGSNGINYGSGGGGGASGQVSAAAAGGNGIDGLVIITEYI